MELTKENYLKWFDHEDKQIAVAAFHSAFKANLAGDSMFDFIELCQHNPMLTKSAMQLLAEEQYPKREEPRESEFMTRLADKITAYEHLPLLLFEVIAEYYFSEFFFDAPQEGKIRQFIRDYEPDAEEAGDYLLNSLVYSCTDDFEKLERIAKSVSVDEAYEAKLEKFLASDEFTCLYGAEHSSRELNVLNVMIVLISKAGVQKQPVLWKYLSCFGVLFVEALSSYLNDNRDRLESFMPMIVQELKTAICGRDELIEECLRLMNDGAKVNANLTTRFFEQSDRWLAFGCGRDELLEKYLQRHPTEGLKVFKLYDRAIALRYCRDHGCSAILTMSWTRDGFWDCVEKDVEVLIRRAFRQVFVDAIKRHGSKEDQFHCYRMVLTACGHRDRQIAKTALDMLASFDGLIYIKGDVCSCLADLEYSLRQTEGAARLRLKSYINWFIDLAFARPYCYEKCLDVEALDDFCRRYGLKAQNFYKNYAAPLKKAAEKKEILKVLQQ